MVSYVQLSASISMRRWKVNARNDLYDELCMDLCTFLESRALSTWKIFSDIVNWRSLFCKKISPAQNIADFLMKAILIWNWEAEVHGFCRKSRLQRTFQKTVHMCKCSRRLYLHILAAFVISFTVLSLFMVERFQLMLCSHWFLLMLCSYVAQLYVF